MPELSVGKPVRFIRVVADLDVDEADLNCLYLRHIAGDPSDLRTPGTRPRPPGSRERKE